MSKTPAGALHEMCTNVLRTHGCRAQFRITGVSANGLRVRSMSKVAPFPCGEICSGKSE